MVHTTVDCAGMMIGIITFGMIPTLSSLLFSFLTQPWQEEFISTQCVPMMPFMKDPLEEVKVTIINNKKQQQQQQQQQ